MIHSSFCNLSPAVMADFDAICMQAMLPKGATLFEESEIADRIIVVCSGLVKVSCTSQAGRVLIQKIARSGDVLGLSAGMSGSPFEGTAETLAPVTTKTVQCDDFLSFLVRHCEARMKVVEILSNEYRFAVIHARRLALYNDVAGRVASILLGWGAEPFGHESKMRLTMDISRENLASLAGTTRETVCRVLGTFQKNHLIKVQGKSFDILLPDKLSQLCA